MTLDPRSNVAAVIDVWSGATTEALEALLAPGYRGHMLGVRGGERVAAGYAEAIERFRGANQGVAFRIVEQFEAGDRGVTRLEARRPGIDGAAPAVSHGINISRFDDEGRLAEEWAIWSPWLDDPAP